MSNLMTAWTYSDWYQPADILDDDDETPASWPLDALTVVRGWVAWVNTDDDAELYA